MVKKSCVKMELCSYVKKGKVIYCKEYSLNGRIVRTECIPYSEFVRLLDLCKKS